MARPEDYLKSLKDDNGTFWTAAGLAMCHIRPFKRRPRVPLRGLQVRVVLIQGRFRDDLIIGTTFGCCHKLGGPSEGGYRVPLKGSGVELRQAWC